MEKLTRVLIILMCLFAYLFIYVCIFLNLYFVLNKTRFGVFFFFQFS